MPYNQNIPLATDKLSQSQADIQNNFQAINTVVSVDHITFGAANQGMHQWVEIPAPGTPAVVAGKIDLFSRLNNVGAFATARNELWVQPSGTTGGILGTLIPATAVSGVANGWTYLPSGIILQWKTTVSGAVTFPQVFPTACLQVYITAVSNGVSKVTAAINSNVAITTAGFTCYAWAIGGAQADQPGTPIRVFALGY